MSVGIGTVGLHDFRLSARVGYADKHILVKLFKAYCSSIYGCELWYLPGEKRAFKELCVAYHSCLKRLVKLPRWARNHDMCLELGLLPCHMLVACRQLSFWQRLQASENTTVRALLAGEIGRHGRCSTSHVNIRHEFDLIGVDLSAIGSSDIRNVFASHLTRFVRERSNLPLSAT